MIFCRGCGKEIHETAVSCPHCGAPQNQVILNSQADNSISAHWTSVTSLVSGIVIFILMILADDGQWDKDTVVGCITLSLPSIIFGIISLANKRIGQWMAITGLILGVISMLVAFGSV